MRKVLTTAALILSLAMLMSISAFGYYNYQIYDENDEEELYENGYSREATPNETPAVEQVDVPVIDPVHRITEDGQIFIRLRPFLESFGVDVGWDSLNNAVLISSQFEGVTHAFVIADTGGFVENGVSWVPFEFIQVLEGFLWNHRVWHDPFQILEDVVERLDLTLWQPERFSDISELPFTSDLPHGEIAVRYIEYMSDNLPARSAFTYRELETATWIVRQLLAMGHSWENIAVQEFTYWELRAMDDADFVFGNINWWSVTSPWILGVDREYQLREDRVSQNVILTIPGQTERKIIVGAHYDSPPYPSASDNASGTALLLESALRMLEQDNYYTIVYVWFGAEEVGLIGAVYYYEMLTQSQRDNIVMMINADVLIEGPYIFFGVGSTTVPDGIDADALRLELLEQILDQQSEHLEMWFEDALVGGWIPEDMTFEQYVHQNTVSDVHWIATMNEQWLLEMAMWRGMLEESAVRDPVVEGVNQIAEELNRAHDFELVNSPGLIHVSSDQMVFLFAGHTVVQFVGMESWANWVGGIAEQLGVSLDSWLIGEDPEELVYWGHRMTVLHTPNDEFHTLERVWPGMMKANMGAFGKMLEGILTARFD